MSKRVAILSGLLVVALGLTAQSCREVPDTPGTAVAPSFADEEQDVIHLGGTWHARSIPGTDRFDLYEVRFLLKGDQKPRTLEELLSLERSGLLRGEDEITPIWVRMEEDLSEKETVQREARLFMMWRPPRPTPPPPGCDCDDPNSWGCLKWCLGN